MTHHQITDARSDRRYDLLAILPVGSAAEEVSFDKELLDRLRVKTSNFK
jgi:hypothetical protein